MCRFCIPEWKEAIAVKKQTLSFKKGERIFVEGETVRGIYFLYEGFAKVHKRWIGQKDLIIRFCRSGDVLGHRGLGDDAIYPVSATAIEDVKACFISHDFLEASLKTNHGLTYTLMQFYARELQKAEQRLSNLAHMEVKGRIAEALLDIREFFGADQDNFISVIITRQDIASYAGTTYETVFKFFVELQQAGIISTTGKSIRVNKKDKLMQFVQVEANKGLPGTVH
ncbi:MAG TPA: Crp/Fnr family transcriptional regulator [Puia sp.]|nr:Crp/Fnr family transcriptional regulator [Puia sp.]